jgi:heme/copper-type cytochrome/quinol oxidase subunit 3
MISQFIQYIIGMKKTILKFIVWLAIAYVLGYLFFGMEVFEWKFFRTAVFVLLINFMIFSESNMKKLKQILRVPPL